MHTQTEVQQFTVEENHLGVTVFSVLINGRPSRLQASVGPST